MTGIVPWWYRVSPICLGLFQLITKWKNTYGIGENRQAKITQISQVHLQHWFHNVLDIHRTSWRCATRYWDSVGEPCAEAVGKLALYFNTIVCSYCHSEQRVNRVVEACLNGFAHQSKALVPKLVVITCQPTGQFGKLAVLKALLWAPTIVFNGVMGSFFSWPKIPWVCLWVNFTLRGPQNSTYHCSGPSLWCTPPPTPNMTVEHPPFEDVFPIENGNFPNIMLVFRGVLCCSFWKWVFLTRIVDGFWGHYKRLVVRLGGVTRYLTK